MVKSAVFDLLEGAWPTLVIFLVIVIIMRIFYLKNTNKKINVICQQVGYPDPKYFCTLFKKETGVTPNQYRSNNI